MPIRKMHEKEITGSLRVERRNHGMSQADLARALGAGGTTVSAWENQGSSIGLDEAWQIADVYGISIDQLAGRVPAAM